MAKLWKTRALARTLCFSKKNVKCFEINWKLGNLRNFSNNFYIKMSKEQDNILSWKHVWTALGTFYRTTYWVTLNRHWKCEGNRINVLNLILYKNYMLIYLSLGRNCFYLPCPDNSICFCSSLILPKDSCHAKIRNFEVHVTIQQDICFSI